MEISESTPTSEVTIAGKTFSVYAPYSEGDVLNEAEANQLNQVRREAIRNGCAKFVKEWDGSEEGLIEAVHKYDLDYSFGTRRGAATPRDPVLTEARRLARGAIRDQLKRIGQSATSEAIDAAVEEYLGTAAGEQLKLDVAQTIAKRTEAAKNIMASIGAILPPGA